MPAPFLERQPADPHAATASYDSRPNTLAHIEQVRSLLSLCALDLKLRAAVHDKSKLVAPEREVFDVVTPKLANLTYGSEEYKASLREMGPALAHHYEANDHHPEHFIGGVAEMNLLQVLEMCCDWIAASRRHADGDPLKSLAINQARFGYGDEVAGLIERTVRAILAMDSTDAPREGLA